MKELLPFLFIERNKGLESPTQWKAPAALHSLHSRSLSWDPMDPTHWAIGSAPGLCTRPEQQKPWLMLVTVRGFTQPHFLFFTLDWPTGPRLTPVSHMEHTQDKPSTFQFGKTAQIQHVRLITMKSTSEPSSSPSSFIWAFCL